MRYKILGVCAAATGLVLSVAWLVDSRHRASAVSIDSTCTTSPTATTVSGSTLDTATPTRSGVVYSTGSAALQLQKLGGNFGGTLLGITNKILSGCAADFDGDGWVDFVGIGTGADGKLTFFKNQTYDNPAPTDWYNPALIRTPKFVPSATPIFTDTAIASVVTGCADFNNDGKTDIALLYCSTSGTVCTPVDKAYIFLGNGNGTFQTKYQFVSSLSSLVSLAWSSNSLAFTDYNKDGKIDMVYGVPEVSGSTGGKVIVLYNDGTSSPKFDTSTPTVLINNAGYGVKGPDAIAVGDFTNDGITDYILGGVSSANLRLYPGLLGGGVGTYQNIASGYASPATMAFSGGATAILPANFSLSGTKDIVIGTDGAAGYYTGGRLFYDKNSGTGTPFSAGASYNTQVGTLTDLDMGWVFDYDHDPDTTPDLVMADGNNSGSYYVFANRVSSKYVTCGTVDSGDLDIGSLATTEMTVTDVRIGSTTGVSPTGTSGTTVTWQASNNGGLTWINATACTDDSTKACATFGSTIGHQIRWRAKLCSNSSQSATPTISAVSTSYTYVTATNHFRAGPIAKDGIIYVGAFREPGDAGQVFAINDATGATMWNAATILDSTSSSARKIYTMASDNTRLDFSTSSSSSATFRSTLQVSDAAAATTLVNWFVSARFGLTTMHVLGAIENSTGALLSPPSKPYWFNDEATSGGERVSITAFLKKYADRKQLLFIGSKDGALHAFRTNPTNSSDSTNGTEAWAFIPYDVARRLLSDKTAGTSTAYPDGSPTLTNAKINGNWRTVLLSGEANGGRAVYALDVTETIDSSGNVVGPTPLWQFSDSAMGNTYSKPTVIRTKVSGQEQWMAVFASGAGSTPDIGDTLYAVDLYTGTLLWKFNIGDTSAYISTDITAMETDDESGTKKDGYIDRLFFADTKGRVWKLDPGVYDASAKTIESIGPVTVAGLTHKALFSTLSTSGALGADRAIASTIAAAEDSTNRLVLYFGTGGTEDTANNVQNAFYGVYADTGAIRSKLDASTGLALGVKFYGGVVYNDGQLIFTDGQDLSGLGLCSPSAGKVVAIDANTFAQQFTVSTSSKIVAPVFSQTGEIYTVTLKGEVLASAYNSTSGTTSTGTSSSGSGGSGGSSGSSDYAASETFTIVSWTQPY